MTETYLIGYLDSHPVSCIVVEAGLRATSVFPLAEVGLQVRRSSHAHLWSKDAWEVFTFVFGSLDQLILQCPAVHVLKRVFAAVEV